MPNPIEFTSATPRFALPLLFAGQAQKEFFVNEAHGLIDALVHPAAEGASNAPPIAPIEGNAWLVTATAQDEWTGRENYLATYVGTHWLFAPPQVGMQIFRKDLGQFAIFTGTWELASQPIEPSGGVTIDAEARDAIAGLTAALRTVGILPQS